MKQLVLFFLCVFLISCDHDDDGLIINTGTNSYLPLQVGNEWKFVPTPVSTGEQYTFKRVVSTVTLNNHQYAEVVSGYAIATEVPTDTSYYRIDDNKFVYVLRKGGTTEENLFRLDSEDGDSWNIERVPNYVVSIDVSVVTLQLDGKDLKNCKGFYWDVDKMVDEEYTTTLAKDIGFVKLYSDAWANGSILKSAIINGHQLNF